jgi:hypothetical protein
MTEALHAIYDLSQGGRGWQALCECGWASPVRRVAERANADAVDHLAAPIIARIARVHDPKRHPAAFARALAANSELSALLEVLEHRDAADAA